MGTKTRMLWHPATNAEGTYFAPARYVAHFSTSATKIFANNEWARVLDAFERDNTYSVEYDGRTTELGLCPVGEERRAPENWWPAANFSLVIEDNPVKFEPHLGL